MSSTAFEFFDDDAMQCLSQNLKLKSPLETQSQFYVLIETHGSNPVHDSEKVNALLDSLANRELVQDGTIAQDAKQVRQF